MKWNYDEISKLTGKVAVVTGANRGLGYEISKHLVKHDCEVILACRNLEKGKKAQKRILDQFPDSNTTVIELNLADFNSIHQFKDQLSDKYSTVDYLVNNAGIFHSPQLESKDGFELHLAVNHLGHFLLTNLLFDHLKNSEEGRIVTESSIGYKMGKIHFDDINLTQNFTRSKGYAQSKLANLMFSFELQRKLNNNDIDGIKSIATHPGIVDTDIYKTGPRLNKFSLWKWFYYPFYFFFAQSHYKGSLSTLRAITDSTLQGGEFIGPTKLFGIRGRPKIIEPKENALDQENANRLWEISEEMTDMSFKI